jgi:D-alanyl-D-alanine-carboxypeptidase/D-alanyl-D-alanine-endopeptidase
MIFPRRAKSTLLAASLAVAIAGVTAKDLQAEDLVLKEATSMMGMVLALSSGAPGLVVAAVRGEESVVLGFGATRPGGKTEPNGRSVLRMGSIAKTMAGQVLASMAADGTIKLTDPLAKYAPPGVKVPSFAGRQITLIDLATYTAGLPRELPDAPEPQPGQNPFTRFQTDAYWRWLSGATLAPTRGVGVFVVPGSIFRCSRLSPPARSRWSPSLHRAER